MHEKPLPGSIAPESRRQSSLMSQVSGRGAVSRRHPPFTPAPERTPRVDPIAERGFPPVAERGRRGGPASAAVAGGQQDPAGRGGRRASRGRAARVRRKLRAGGGGQGGGAG